MEQKSRHRLVKTMKTKYCNKNCKNKHKTKVDIENVSYAEGRIFEMEMCKVLQKCFCDHCSHKAVLSKGINSRGKHVQNKHLYCTYFARHFSDVKCSKLPRQ